jgi:hypothetical protein
MVAVWSPLDSPDSEASEPNTPFPMTLQTIGWLATGALASPFVRVVGGLRSPFLLALVSACALGGAWMLPAGAASSVALGSASAGPGEDAVLNLQFQSDANPTALQFDVRFDANALSPGFAVGGAAMNGYVVRSASPGPGMARVLVYSAANLPIPNGLLGTFPLRVRASAVTGTTPVTISNLVVSSSLGTRVEPATSSGGLVTVRNEAAPSFQRPSVAVNGQLVLRLNGQDGRSYTLQVSTDLRNWETASTAIAASGVAVFNDTPVLGSSHRYYRALAAP